MPKIRRNSRTRVSQTRTRKALARGIELLEQRLLLSGSPLSVSADWFETVGVLAEYAPAGEGFLRAASGNDQQSAMAMRDTTRWVVQLSAEALQEYSSVSETVSMFDGTDLTVLYGLGLPGQMLIGAGCTTTGEAVRFFESNKLFESFEADAVQLAASMPNDPKLELQFGLHNTDQAGGLADADIDAPEAWDITTGSRDVVVAVIDSGVDYTHPDLAANIWTNPGEVAGDGIDNDLNGFIDDVHGWDFRNNDADPMDDNSHGTHVAGIIGAVGNNDLGVTGVAQQTSIMALKFLDSRNSGFASDAVRAINYATMMNREHDVPVGILNNSWVSTTTSVGLYSSVKSAEAQDILVVAAAGNAGYRGHNIDESPHFPASYNLPNVLSVAASDSYNNIARFSNYGPDTVDIAAPGTSIYSTYPTSLGEYGYDSGTSMAAPHVSGTAALVWAHLPDATLLEVRDAILEGADQIDRFKNKVVGNRMLNAEGALLVDTYAPRAELAEGTLVTSGGMEFHQITVSYRDNLSLKYSSIDDNDVLIRRAGSSEDPIAVVLKDTNATGNSPALNARYKIPGPGGSWDPADNGLYEVLIRAEEIGDTAGHFAQPVVIGVIDVQIKGATSFTVNSFVDTIDIN
ncbi:MAG TPA: LEPR-XLL domain-containing protein, partial [Pseudomonadales bacterium]|nr:LEPR-XLL domain-containing protein [Pseudomonadales bacterium]